MLETVLTSAVVSLFTALGTALIEEKKFRKEFELDRERVRTEFMAEEVAKRLLNSEKWKQRSFEAVQRRLRGFDGDELRKILIRAGAVCFEDKDGNELWGLLDRNKDAL